MCRGDWADSLGRFCSRELVSARLKQYWQSTPLMGIEPMPEMSGSIPSSNHCRHVSEIPVWRPLVAHLRHVDSAAIRSPQAEIFSASTPPKQLDDRRNFDFATTNAVDTKICFLLRCGRPIEGGMR